MRATAEPRRYARPWLAFAGGCLLTLAGLLPALPAEAATTVVGTIPGQFSVSATGAATYTIPIALPRGSGGLTPSIALVYNSQSSSGAAGWGWTLAGLSAITRCNKTIDDDGAAAGIALTAADAYCFDGERLKLTGGSYGTDGATYDTELRRYLRITEHNDSSAAGGPSYWTVEAKNGTTFEYGNSNDSKILATGTTVVRVWALDKVTDANGNYYAVTYTNKDVNGDTIASDYWPTEISYSGNAGAGTSPLHTITFGWTPRSTTTVQATFVDGTLVTQTQLLSTITLGYNGATTFTYSLVYQTDSANSRNLLHTIQECDANNECFPVTTINWQDGAVGWTGDVAANAVTVDPEAGHLMDVNGDGIEDLVYPGGTDWMVMFGKPGGGFGSQVDTGISDTDNGADSNYQYAIATDYNGDGRMDLMVPSSSGSWYVLEGTGSESTPFTRVWTTLSDTQTYPDPSTGTATPVYEGGVAMADFAGNGLGDYLWTDGSNLYRIPNNGPAANPQFGAQQTLGVWSGSLGGYVPLWGLFYDSAMNFDGSGRDGRMGFKVNRVAECIKFDPQCVTAYFPEYFWGALVPTASGFTGTASLSCFQNNMTPLPFDATGGGLTDLLYACQEPNWSSSPPPSTFDFLIELGTGTGFYSLDTGVTYSSGDPVFADYFGDGRREALIYNGSSWSMVRVNYDAASEKFVPAVSASDAPYPGGYVSGSMQVGSIEADGLDDLVYAVKNSVGAYVWHYNLHAVPAGGVADVVTSIIDGLGNSYSPAYAPLTNTSAYTEGSGAIYPNQDLKSPLWVVTSYSATDGAGGTYTKSFSYSGAETEVEGRGFLGFASRNATDSRNGVLVNDSFDQTFPDIGEVIGQTVTQSNGSVLSTTNNNYTDTVTGSGYSALYFPYLTTSTQTENDTSGNALKTITTTNTFGDGYGDLTDQTVQAVDKSSGLSNGQTFTTEIQTVYADTAGSTYCISIPKTATVTKTSPTGSMVRESDSSSGFDTTHCRPTQTVVEAGADSATNVNGSASNPLTTALQYDAYGNVSQTAVSGAGMQNRVTNTSYVNDGEYPGSVSRVVNASLSITTGTAWNSALGVKTSATDQNGHTTTFTPDGFGRTKSETAPDGVTSSWGYTACGSSCVANGVYYVSQSVSNNGGTQTIPVGTTEYDAKGRVVAVGKVLLGGAKSWVETTYDALGRATAVSKPFFSSPQYWTDTSYNVLNRPTNITAPANQSDSSNSDKTTITYSGFTTAATEIAPNTSGITSETTTTITDALGEITSKSDGSEAAKTTYNYDPFGDLISTTDADQHPTSMTYDGLGHKIGMNDPNMGSWSYTLDALGEVLTQTDADSNTITQSYDALGRLTGRTEKNSGGSVTASDTWTWDSAQYGIGLLASESDSVSGFTKVYTYDSLSRPENVDTTANGTDYQVSTSYDSFGRVQTLTYPASVSPSVPVASAVASPTSAVVGNNVTLNGSGSTDPNGLTLSYRWSQTAGPASATISSPTGETTTVTTNTPGVYTFQLVVSDQNASSTPATVSVNFEPPAPGAPTTSPNPSTTGGYTVSWSGVTGATSYEVYESTDGTNYSDLGSISGTSDSLSGKSDGNYYYKVAACENSVCGPLSAASSAESVLLPPPVPTGLAVSPNPSTTGSFTLSWNSTATATSYKVFLSGNGTPIGTPTATSFSTSEGDGSYSFYVEACNSAGCSGASASVSETVTLPPGTPATPSMTPNPSTTGNFTVSWSAPSGGWSTGELEESPDNSTWTEETSWTSSSPATSWPGSGFGNGSYYFRTIYCDGTACSTSGSGSETVTLPPAAPTNLTASPNPSTNGSYTLSWTAPAGPVTAYNIYNNSTGGFINSTTGTSASFGGIADGTYSYYVKACNQTACGAASNTASVTVLHPPGQPSSISLNPTSTYTLDTYTLSWGNASGTVSNYEVNGSASYSASTFSASYSKIRAGNYTYYVQACNSSGCGPATATVTETVLSGTGGCKTCSPTTSPQTSSPSPSSPTPAPSATSGGGLANAGLNLNSNPAAALESPSTGTLTVSAVVGSPVILTISHLHGEVVSSASSAISCSSSFGIGGRELAASSPSIPSCNPPFEKGGEGRSSERAVMDDCPGLSDEAGMLSLKGGGISGAACAISMLTQERQSLAAHLSQQPGEAQMQAAANARERAALPSILPPAPEKDVVAWTDWAAAYKKQHPNGPSFAPPEYIAYAGVKLVPASGSTYRFEVQYNYDPASGALASISNAQTGFVYWQAASGGAAPVDAFGHLLAYTDGNNVSTVIAYDQATGAPVGISSGIGQSSAVQQLAYAWDGFGNLTERQDANQSSLYEKLIYDDLNRLTESQVTNSASANTGPTNVYNYNSMGNITTRTVAGTSETYNYDPNHPYAVDTVTSGGSTIYSASYDADGNMTSRNGYPITWTVDNLPESIASAQGSSTFSYGPDHQRYYQSATFNGVTTDTTYIGGLFEVVASSTGSTEYRHNISADGQIVAVHTIDANGSASTAYLHYDHLGSVNTITNDQGSVIQSMSFDAFGVRRDASNWDYDLSQNQIATLKNYTDRGYTDQEQLDNLSLVDLNGRVYDPTVGRMISADPTIPQPFYSQAFNRFAYVYDSPLEYTDPSGFETQDCQTGNTSGCSNNPPPPSPPLESGGMLGNVLVTGNPCAVFPQLCIGPFDNIISAADLGAFLQFAQLPATAAPGATSGNSPRSNTPKQKNHSPQNNNKKRSPCNSQSSSSGILGHLFASAGANYGAGAAGELSVSTTNNQATADVGLALGAGAAVHAVVGFQGGTQEPYGITSTFVLGPDAVPVGVYVQITAGPMGTFYRVGIGFEEGEFASTSPVSFNAEVAKANYDQPCTPGN